LNRWLGRGILALVSPLAFWRRREIKASERELQEDDARAPDATIEEVGVPNPVGMGGYPLRPSERPGFGGSGNGYGSQPTGDGTVPPLWPGY
jgi:hypothetical protein